jgi:hypothetical protein
MIEEYAASPNAPHDDMDDEWSQAASRFRTSSNGLVEYYKEEAGTGNAAEESVAIAV